MEENIKLTINENSSNKIFVSIACFMDNDILNTIQDCLEKAECSENIVFGICFQYDPNDDYLKIYDNNSQFRIHRMHWKEAKGPAYARGIIYDLFKPESDDYFFQIDCHTRFFDKWDTKIIESFKICKQINPKCVISHYPININNMNGDLSYLLHIETVRCIDINYGIKTHGKHLNIKDCPKKSWGTSAAMLFFDKQAYIDIPFDKQIYHGLQFEEQVVIAARYWTNGYDIFTPTHHIISTEYMTSSSRQKVRPPTDGNKKRETYERLCHIMKLKYNEKYLNIYNCYLGNERTIEDYYKMLKIYDRIKEVFTNNYLDEQELTANTIIVGSEGMGYAFSEYFIKYILNLTYPNKRVIHKNTDDCDLMIFTHFTRGEQMWNKQKKPYILWNGEKYNLPSNLPFCSSKLTFNSLRNSGYIKIPYAFHAYIEYVKRNIWLKYKTLSYISKRTKLFGYCISADRGDNPRKTFIDQFTKHYSKTYALGRYSHEKSIRERVNDKWMDEKLQEKYSEFKFILAAENEIIDGYLTEKIINAYSSGAIPIYIGDSNYAKKIFNPKSFICVSDFNNHEECIKYIINLSDNELESYYKEPIFTYEKESEIFREVDNRYCPENKNIINSIKRLMGEIVDDQFSINNTSSNIPTVLINLKSAKDKLIKMTTLLNDYDIPFTRFNSILGDDIYEDFKSKNKFLNNGYTLRPHQVGIWQSHMYIWKHMIEHNINKVLILEDDCLFVNNFKSLYDKSLDLIKDKEYDIFYLGYSGCDINSDKDLYLIDNGIPRTTHSYILSLSGAKKLVEKLSVIDFPIDELIGRMFDRKELNGYRTSYLLIYQPWLAEGHRRNKFFPEKLLHLIENKPVILKNEIKSEISYKQINFKSIPKYYINLERRTDRNNCMIEFKNKFSSLSNLKRFNAYDGRNINDLDNLPLNITLRDNQKINIINKSSVSGGMLSYGGLGCAISHKKILDSIIENNYEDTIILEDDIEFVDNFDEILENIKIPNHYDMFFIGYHSAPNSESFNDQIDKCHRIYGTFGMIISLNCAKKLINDFKVFNPLQNALDTAYYRTIPPNQINKYCIKLNNRLIHHLKQNTEENPSDIIV